MSSGSGPEPQALRELRRLGKNINGYFGETIDISGILSDCVGAARAHGWTSRNSPPPLIFTCSP